MSLHSEPHPMAIDERLRDALALTPSLLADVIHQACGRFLSLGQGDNTARVARLIELGAFTDAALVLIELELPQWQIRRLAYDDGEWYCALSRERELPDWLDQSVEGRHADLALAILSAMVEVRHLDADGPRTGAPHAPNDTSPLYEPLLSDNFS